MRNYGEGPQTSVKQRIPFYYIYVRCSWGITKGA